MLWRRRNRWPNEFDKIVQSWDTASKVTELSDHSVCTTWGIYNKMAYLIDVYRARLDFPALKRKALELYSKYKPSTIVVEDKSSGIQLIQEFKAANFYRVNRSSLRAIRPCASTRKLPSSRGWTGASGVHALARGLCSRTYLISQREA